MSSKDPQKLSATMSQEMSLRQFFSMLIKLSSRFEQDKPRSIVRRNVVVNLQGEKKTQQNVIYILVYNRRMLGSEHGKEKFSI